MHIAARLEQLPRPVWIGLMVAGFVWFWPVGLAILAYLIWSGRMSCWKQGHGRWHNLRDGAGRDGAGRDGAGRAWSCGGRRREATGNRAFDDYRDEALRRLEEEKRDFLDFLERLRHAKDRAEFDQFMAERRRPAPTDGPPAA